MTPRLSLIRRGHAPLMSWPIARVVAAQRTRAHLERKDSTRWRIAWWILHHTRAAAVLALVSVFAASWWGLSATSPETQLYASLVLLLCSAAFAGYTAAGGRWPR